MVDGGLVLGVVVLDWLVLILVVCMVDGFFVLLGMMSDGFFIVVVVDDWLVLGAGRVVGWSVLCLFSWLGVESRLRGVFWLRVKSRLRVIFSFRIILRLRIVLRLTSVIRVGNVLRLRVEPMLWYISGELFMPLLNLLRNCRE
jgi:hypothetical protein